VADEDPAAVAFLVETLRRDGHAVFHAYDVLAVTQLAYSLESCDLVISDTKVEGADGVELIALLRQRRPNVPVTEDGIRATVNAMLDGDGDGNRR
jgi:DNA-binding response OmpR family regulator